MNRFDLPKLDQTTVEAIAILLGSNVPGIRLAKQQLVIDESKWSSFEREKFRLLMNSIGRLIEAAHAGELHFDNGSDADNGSDTVYN